MVISKIKENDEGDWEVVSSEGEVISCAVTSMDALEEALLTPGVVLPQDKKVSWDGRRWLFSDILGGALAPMGAVPYRKMIVVPRAILLASEMVLLKEAIAGEVTINGEVYILLDVDVIVRSNVLDKMSPRTFSAIERARMEGADWLAIKPCKKNNHN